MHIKKGKLNLEGWQISQTEILLMLIARKALSCSIVEHTQYTLLVYSVNGLYIYALYRIDIVYILCIFCNTRPYSRKGPFQGRSHGGEWGGVRTPPLLFWRSFLILSKPGRNVWGGGKAAMDITVSFYTQDIRVLGIRTPPTSLGLATPLDHSVNK